MFKRLSGNVFLISLHYFCVNFTVLLNIFLTVILCKRTFSGWNSLHELLSIATLFLFMLLCFSQSIVTVTDGDFVNRFNSTLQMVHAAGETNRIQQGLFENYLESKVKDPYLLLVSYFYARCTHRHSQCLQFVFNWSGRAGSPREKQFFLSAICPS